MHDQDTPSPRTSWKKAVAIIVAPILVVAALDRIVQWASPGRETLTHRLKVPPRSGQVYLLGNSMFKTGIDVALLRQRLPATVRVDLAYHDGEYTNLWYLIVKNALLPAPHHPRLLVWGFRPTYAIRPAFRKKQVCDVDRFYVAPDPRFDAIQGGLSLSTRERFHLWLAEQSWLYRYREALQKRLFRWVRARGLSAVSLMAPRQAADLKRLDQTGGDALTDVLARLVSGGKIQRAEERVVDAGRKRFVYGKEQPFGRSFVPVTVKLLKAHRVPQLVIIFKPVVATEGQLPPAVQDYYRQARAFLDAEAVPYLDLVAEPRLKRHHYGSGDHYNVAGRRIVTESLARWIIFQLGGAP